MIGISSGPQEVKKKSLITSLIWKPLLVVDHKVQWVLMVDAKNQKLKSATQQFLTGNISISVFGMFLRMKSGQVVHRVTFSNSQSCAALRWAPGFDDDLFFSHKVGDISCLEMPWVISQLFFKSLGTQGKPTKSSIKKVLLFTNSQGHLHLVGLWIRGTSFCTESLKSLCWFPQKATCWHPYHPYMWFSEV